MDSVCSGCGTTVSGADVLYTADARVVCAACSAGADLGAARARADLAGVALAAGLIAGVIPFVIQTASSSVVIQNGVVVSAVYRDWVAIGCGIAAAVLGAIAFVTAVRARMAPRAVGTAAIVLLGVYQIARGFGVFAPDPGTDGSFQVTLPEHPAPAPVPADDPDDPATCADPEACFALGRRLAEAGDLPGTAAAYLRACELGNAAGCFNAAIRAAKGEPGAPDPARSTTLFGKACDLGDADGCANVAISYMLGEGVAKDVPRAFELLTKACDAGSGLGCKNLGALYQDGTGVAKDPGMAVALIAKGCELADADVADGCTSAGIALLLGRGVKRDPARAVTYLARACEMEPARCHDLGVVHADGDGIPKDAVRARELYDRACAAGKLESCNNLADLMNRGEGGAKDREGARALFETTCDRGLALACTNLADL